MSEEPASSDKQVSRQSSGNPVSGRGLSVKLLILTILFIMLAEILIFVPSVANFRNLWLRTHLDISEAASIVYLDSSDNMLSADASANLLETTQSLTVAVRREGRSQLIASSSMPSQIWEHIDLDRSTAFGSIQSAFSMLFAHPDTLYRVFGALRSREGEIEMVQRVEHIQNALWSYSRNIMFLSLLISIFAAGLVYLALYRMIVLPMIRISENMDAFSKSPEDQSLVYKPTNRGDELGIAEHRLSSLQSDLQNTLRQKKHLADLGLAVSKINHDLRNILASAQLFSDRLSILPDPTVQRFAPKLIRTIDRAVDYTKSVIDYGRAVEAPPKRRMLMLRNVAEEVAELLGLNPDGPISWQNKIDADLQADADPEQLLRVLMNICRNAQQAMNEPDVSSQAHRLVLEAERDNGGVAIRITDTGPGIPPRILEKIFDAFEGSGKVGGTGLGMSIAHELVRAHGGEIKVEETSEEGTVFFIHIPDQEKSIDQESAA